MAAYMSVLSHKHDNVPGAKVKSSKSYMYNEVISRLFRNVNVGTMLIVCIGTFPRNWWSGLDSW